MTVAGVVIHRVESAGIERIVAAEPVLFLPDLQAVAGCRVKTIAAQPVEARQQGSRITQLVAGKQATEWPCVSGALSAECEKAAPGFLRLLLHILAELLQQIGIQAKLVLRL